MCVRFFLPIFVGCAQLIAAQTPQVSSGTVQRFENFPSQYVAARHVDVWLPEGYSTRKKYAVLYLHDGQMLFDSAQTWNHQEWQADETIGRLIKTGQIRACIVVGIWNSGKSRHADYFPQKPFERLPPAEQDRVYQALRLNGQSVFNGHKIQSDAYLKFIVKELKPFIEKRFSVKKGRKNTFIAGSSMGGLISLYAICEYPSVFGGAACLSTHWPGIFVQENNPFPPALLEYLEDQAPDPKKHRLYFDHGTLNLDGWYAPHQQKADVIFQKKGYSAPRWLSKVFAGEDHSERCWAKRFELPVTFLLGR